MSDLSLEMAVTGKVQVAAMLDADHGNVPFDGGDAEQFTRDPKKHLAAISRPLRKIERAGADTRRNIKHAGGRDTQHHFRNGEPPLGIAIGAGERRAAQDTGHIRINQLDRIQAAGLPEEDRPREVVVVEFDASFESEVIFEFAEARAAARSCRTNVSNLRSPLSSSCPPRLIGKGWVPSKVNLLSTSAVRSGLTHLTGIFSAPSVTSMKVPWPGVQPLSLPSELNCLTSIKASNSMGCKTKFFIYAAS